MRVSLGFKGSREAREKACLGSGHPHLIGAVATGPSLHSSFLGSHGCTPFPQHQGAKEGGVRRDGLWAEWSWGGGGSRGAPSERGENGQGVQRKGVQSKE